MVIIKNINITKYTISLNDLTKRNKKFNDLPAEEIKELEREIENVNLSKNEKISFDIHNTNEAFVNAIRRTLIAETPIKYLDVGLKDIVTNDKYFLINTFQQRLNCIPLDQKIDSNAKFNIKLENKTDQFMNVFSTAVTGNSAKITNKYRLYVLNAGKFLIANDIFVATDTGLNNPSIVPCNIDYEDLGDFSVSTLNAKHDKFHISIETFGQIKTLDLLNLGVQQIKLKLSKIEESLNNDTLIIHANATGKIYEIKIKNETHTIGCLLTKYIYNYNDSLLTYYAVKHPLDKDFTLYIKHTDNPKKVIIEAIKLINKDFDEFIKLIAKK